MLDAERPDLLVLGVSVDGLEVSKILETLVRNDYGGKVLVIGQPDSIIVKAVRQIGDEYGIAMLPALPTPFSAGTLRQTLASLMPVEPAPSPAVDVPEGAEGRLARTVVPAEDPSADAGPERRRGADPDAASGLGRGAAGLLHSR